MKSILALIVGIILGGALTYFLLIGAPRARVLQPGTPVSAPDPNGDPPGTAVVRLDENFFNALLGTIFRDLPAPTFRLTAAEKAAPTDGPAPSVISQPVRFIQAQGGCQNQVIVTPEGSGVRTSVRLADGRILAPLAFNGSYNVFGNCLNFRGWAQANVQLYFKAEEQTLYGQINVEGVNLEGVSPLVGGVVTQFVQNAINERVNPLVLLRGSQLALAVPVQASGGTLKAQAKDIRAEVKDNALDIHITYDLSAAGNQAGAPPQS